MKKILAGLLLGTVVTAYAAPTSLDAFVSTATDYVDAGTTVAIAAAVLSLGWVAFRIVRKYTSEASGGDLRDDKDDDDWKDSDVPW